MAVPEMSPSVPLPLHRQVFQELLPSPTPPSPYPDLSSLVLWAHTLPSLPHPPPPLPSPQCLNPEFRAGLHPANRACVCCLAQEPGATSAGL